MATETLTPEYKRDLSLGILAFIEKTERFRAASMHLSDLVATSPTLGLRPDLAMEEVLIASGLTINKCLEVVGGLPGYLDVAPGRKVDILLTTWHGFDPDNAQKHVWTVQPAQPGTIPTSIISFVAAQLHVEAAEILHESTIRQ